MAWNEPGGNDQDPWGSRGKKGGNQGPPDLDEVLGKFGEKVTSIFGGGGSRGTGNGGGSIIALVVVLVVISLLYAVSGFYIVQEAERGVVLRFGQVQDALRGPGLNWNPPLIDDVEVINIQHVRKYRGRERMLTEDVNIVEADFEVQYKVTDPKAFFLNVLRPENSLQHAMESALRHEVGSESMDNILTQGRAALADQVQIRLQTYLNNYGTGIHISKVNIENVEAPKEVRDAFQDVNRAREDQTRVQSEAEQYANGIVPEARGKAARIIEEANGYKSEVVARSEGEAARFDKLLAEYKKAPKVTRERLYLDAIESVYANSTKVMIDVEGGNNLLYLPLDKLVEQSRSQSSVSSSISDTVQSATEEFRQRRDTSSRRREVR